MLHEVEVEVVITAQLDDVVDDELDEVIELFEVLLLHTEVDDDEVDIQCILLIVVLDEMVVNEYLLSAIQVLIELAYHDEIVVTNVIENVFIYLHLIEL